MRGPDVAGSREYVTLGGHSGLWQIGSVIRNPEVQALVPVLLKAYADPKYTGDALKALLQTGTALRPSYFVTTFRILP